MQEDAKIIQLYWDRDESAIAHTDEKYGKYCHSIAYNILHSHPDAQECVNDTYLQVWNAIPPQRPDRFRAFLGKIVRNLALNRYAHSHAQKRSGTLAVALDEVAEFLPDPKETGDFTEELRLREVINGFVASLPKETRIIFVRRYWYMSSVRNIARDLSIPVGTVKSILFRTRKQFRDYLEKEGVSI